MPGAGAGQNATAGPGAMSSGPAPRGSGLSRPAARKKAKPKGTVLGQASDIPVGGGAIYTAAKVVVTQPASGQYKAFSAVCTHVGCLVNKVTSGTIDCPCHGSEFRITSLRINWLMIDLLFLKKILNVGCHQIMAFHQAYLDGFHS